MPDPKQIPDPWPLLRALGKCHKLDKQTMACLVTWRLFETHHELPYLEAVRTAVMREYKVNISLDTCSHGRALFQELLNIRD